MRFVTCDSVMLPGICAKEAFSTTSTSGAWLVVVLSLLSRVAEIVVAFGFSARPKFEAGAVIQPWTSEVMSNTKYLLAAPMHCAPEGQVVPEVTNVMEGVVL